MTLKGLPCVHSNSPVTGRHSFVSFPILFQGLAR